MNPPVPPKELTQFAKSVGASQGRPPDRLYLLDNSIPYHACRIALLIRIAGRPREVPVIDGRTKLAKLDFFVRYPVFLARAINIAGSQVLKEQAGDSLQTRTTPESHMVRYRYGPWDQKYYSVFAFLLGKRLITIDIVNGIDHYASTAQGYRLTDELQHFSEWQEIAVRCELVGQLFEGKSGSFVKDFIYRHYPEVVHTPFTDMISSDFESSTSYER